MGDKNLATAREFLLLSDFDQTLSFRDSGHVLAEMLGIPDFQEHVRRLSETHLVQQGGELAYLLLHDAAFRSLRREHLQEAGTKVRLKSNIHTLSRILEDMGAPILATMLSPQPHKRSLNRRSKASSLPSTSLPVS